MKFPEKKVLNTHKMQMMDSKISNIEQMTALVTGASSGMGLEYARQLASAGCSVVMVSNQEVALAQCAEDLRRQFSVDIWTKCIDLALPAAADDLWRYCEEKGLKIDILINNAGMFFFEELEGGTCHKAEVMMMLHVYTPSRLCMLFGNAMKRRGSGYILNVSSVAAGMCVPGLTTYAATKSYLKSFSKSLYYEMRPYGVSVTTVCPGAVATGLYSVLPALVKILEVAGKFGLVYSPEKLVRKALRAMFRHRRCVTPGFINHFFAPAVNAIPQFAVDRIWRKIIGKK